MDNLENTELNQIEKTTRPQDLIDLLVRIFGAPPKEGYNPSLYDVMSGGGTVTASNGLTKIGSDVKLGGTLTEDTTVGGTGILNLGNYTYGDRLLEFHINSKDIASIAAGYSDTQNVGISVYGDSGGGNTAYINATNFGNVVEASLNGAGLNLTTNNYIGSAIIRTSLLDNQRIYELPNDSGTLIAGLAVTTNIIQASWAGNTDYQYTVTVTGAETGDFCLVMPDHVVLDIINTNNTTWQGYAYCGSNGNVTVVCRVGALIAIAPTQTFTVKVLK